jgi:hypothetical protein
MLPEIAKRDWRKGAQVTNFIRAITIESGLFIVTSYKILLCTLLVFLDFICRTQSRVPKILSRRNQVII